MASNAFGNLFRITTWGESHGKAIGVVIDGCPAGLPLKEEDIARELVRRATGRTALTSPRKEPDEPQILSGVFEGLTTGTPISIVVWNRDSDSRPYDAVKNLLRPGHANHTYQEKYGVFDYRGSGRASARETVGRVAAGAVAKKLLASQGVVIQAFVKTIGTIEADKSVPEPTSEMNAAIEAAMLKGDSLGGVIEFVATGVPSGWGDPIYEKLEANLAKAMLSLPASKGFEIGLGFEAARMSGGSHNDCFIMEQGVVRTTTNHSGGTLGGISNGMPIVGRVAFKPPSSIGIPQQTLDTKGNEQTLSLPEGSRHDPCVIVRALPIVEAMTALVLADAMLLQRCSRVSG